MTNTEQLARRAMACPGWKWLPGMLTDSLGHHRIYAVGYGELYGVDPLGNVTPLSLSGVLPDLTDPATMGCLLALVREAWPTAAATTGCHSYYCPSRGHYDGWTVAYCSGEKWEQAAGKTEAEALVAALEAAEGKE